MSVTPARTRSHHTSVVSAKPLVLTVGVAIAVAGLTFLLAYEPIARWYNDLYTRLPGHLRLAGWWPRAFGAVLFAFGALFIGLGAAAVR